MTQEQDSQPEKIIPNPQQCVTDWPFPPKWSMWDLWACSRSWIPACAAPTLPCRQGSGCPQKQKHKPHFIFIWCRSEPDSNPNLCLILIRIIFNIQNWSTIFGQTAPILYVVRSLQGKPEGDWMLNLERIKLKRSTFQVWSVKYPAIVIPQQISRFTVTPSHPPPPLQHPSVDDPQRYSDNFCHFLRWLASAKASPFFYSSHLQFFDIYSKVETLEPDFEECGFI